MAEPVVGSLAEEVLDSALEPYVHAEQDNDWPLTTLVGAILDRAQEIADLARETDTHPGWGKIVDPDEAPLAWLPWTAQLVGVRIPPPGSPEYSSLTEAGMRLRIKETDGQRRGTVAALMGAARQYLGGSRQVWVIERHGSPYRVTVATLASETPKDGTPISTVDDYAELATYGTYQDVLEDAASYSVLTGLAYEAIDSALLTAALLEQKPAGLVLTHNIITGEMTYDALRDVHADYAEVESVFADYADVLLDPLQT